MSIADIARMAGVSASTVSKIVNGKDDDISSKTRERVLALVKEYNYVPYSAVIQAANPKTLLIGFLSDGSEEMSEVFAGAAERAQNDNYAIISCYSGTEERELKNASILRRSKVDGVIWESGKGTSPLQEYFENANIRTIPIGASENGPFGIDYESIGYQAARTLTNRGHVRIACVYYPHSDASLQFHTGFDRCLTELGLLDENDNTSIPFETMEANIFSHNTTGFACFDEKITAEVRRLASSRNLLVPGDISIVGLCRRASNTFSGHISMLMLPARAYGAAICGYLIDLLEKRDTGGFSFDWNLSLDSDASVDYPFDARRKSILVVGSVNIDVLLHIEDVLQTGKTMTAHTMSTIPGGKGLNQSIGAAKLEANTSLIASIGSDHEGLGIRRVLQEHKVNIKGVETDRRRHTGRAYIYVPPDGDSSVIVYAGANTALSGDSIKRNSELFRNAGYCLLPTELSAETIEATLGMAKKHGVKTILKPATLRHIPGSFWEMIDYFVPNEKEAKLLFPEALNIRECASRFLSRGVGTVIITCGADGCFVMNKETEFSYAAEDVQVMDTTGGADAFICTLAVYLNDAYSLENAVAYATAAAGLCVSRQGVLPAMVDRTTLELYVAHRWR